MAMLPFHLPRRFRRRLLLPLGWVALGFLPLGCPLLREHWQQVRPAYVLQLTMPALEPTATTLASHRRYHNFPEPPYPAIYKSLAELDTLRPWHSIELKGKPIYDFFGVQAIETAIRTINTDSSHAGGVRVRFQRGATYSDLVRVLDTMQTNGPKKYWLDIRYQPATFYALTDT